MSLKFAVKWNYDYEKNAPLKMNGKDFGFTEARAVLRDALNLIGGAGLREFIDNHPARVINGPHKSADPSLHMTVLGKRTTGGEACFHVYVTKEGNANKEKGVSPGPTTKKGHALDDWDSPIINHSRDL